jgi:hypothetical protein
VNLVADFHRREDERNRGGGENVVLTDPGASHQGMKPQAVWNSDAWSRVDENHRLPGSNVCGAHRERSKRAAPDVLPEPAPADVSAYESGERGRVEDASCLSGTAEEHAIEACGLTQTKTKDMRQLEAGPNGDELFDSARHVTDRRCDEGPVDRANTGAGDQVDLRSFSIGVEELAEDVLEDPNLIRSSRTTSRKYQAKATHYASSSFKPNSRSGLSQKSSLDSSRRIPGGSQID